MKIFSKDTFVFRETRIILGNKGAGVDVMDGLREPDGLRKVGTGNLIWLWGMGDNLWWLGKVGSVGVEEIIIIAFYFFNKVFKRR